MPKLPINVEIDSKTNKRKDLVMCPQIQSNVAHNECRVCRYCSHVLVEGGGKDNFRHYVMCYWEQKDN